MNFAKFSRTPFSQKTSERLLLTVREWIIEQYLQAEKKMIYLAFAYDDQNCAHYNTYQNVYLSHLKETEHPVFQDLKTKGISGGITGAKFSAICGDFFAEFFRKENKGKSSPFCSRFSADMDAAIS